MVVKYFFLLSVQVFQKFSRDRWKITIFLEWKSWNQLFFHFFIAKGSYIVSKPNDDFHEASFEVYYVSVSQKLAILGFSPQIFFILTSVTSETSWGQSMSLSDLNEVSNFRWRCQRSVPKLVCPKTTISLNRPKSPHWLGLIKRGLWWCTYGKLKGEMGLCLGVWNVNSSAALVGTSLTSGRVCIFNFS